MDVMYSIQPEYVADILKGLKTVEVRKTIPKILFRSRRTYTARRNRSYGWLSMTVRIYTTVRAKS